MGIGSDTVALDSLLTNVEAAASFASEDGQLMTLTDVTGRSIPELQCDAVPVSSPPVFVENLAALGIGARENQLSSCHANHPSKIIAAGDWAMNVRGMTSVRRRRMIKRSAIIELVRKQVKKIW